MKLKGLQFNSVVNVPTLTYAEVCDNFTTHALGGGEWSIEAHSYDFGFIREWVGLNGTRDDEEATDLWAQVDEWLADPEGGQKVFRQGYSYKMWECPDGFLGSYKKIMKEVLAGHLHGLIVTL